MDTFVCEDCRRTLDVDERSSHPEMDECEDCHEAWFQRKRAYWLPLYLGERAAGLIRERDQ